MKCLLITEVILLPRGNKNLNACPTWTYALFGMLEVLGKKFLWVGCFINNTNLLINLAFLIKK